MRGSGNAGASWAIQRRCSLTARSGLRLSLCDTARMTPARQPRQLRPLSPRSGRASSPTATHRNRFPTSSGRVSTAIADTGEGAAASSTAREPTKPCSYWPPMLRRANQRTTAAPQANERGLRGRTGPKGTATSVSRSTTQHSPGLPNSQLLGAAPPKEKTARNLPDGCRRPGGSPGRHHRAAASTTPPPHPLAMLRARCASPSAGAGEGREPRRGSQEPPQMESSAGLSSGRCGTGQPKK